MKRVLKAIGLLLLGCTILILLLVATNQVGFFLGELRTDDELDQVFVGPYTINTTQTKKEFWPSTLYISQFGGPTYPHEYILLLLPKECGSEQYIFNSHHVWVPERKVSALGPLAIWWQPKKVHEIPYPNPSDKPEFGGGPTFNMHFVSPTCGAVRVIF